MAAAVAVAKVVPATRRDWSHAQRAVLAVRHGVTGAAARRGARALTIDARGGERPSGVSKSRGDRFPIDDRLGGSGSADSSLSTWRRTDEPTALRRALR